MVLGPPSFPEEGPKKPCQHHAAQKVAMCTQQPSATGPWRVLSVFGDPVHTWQGKAAGPHGYLWLLPRLGSLLGNYCTQRVFSKAARDLVIG